MFQPKRQNQSPSSIQADGENDSRGFGTPHIRGKGLGMPIQKCLKLTHGVHKDESVKSFKKSALGDVNHKPSSEINLSKLKPKVSAVKGAKECGSFVKPIDSKMELTIYQDDQEVEVNRDANVNPFNISAFENISTGREGVPVLDDLSVEPIIQHYFEDNGEYPEMESITTNYSGYDDDLYYYSRSSPISREMYNRTFEETDEKIDIDVLRPLMALWGSSVRSETLLSTMSSVDDDIDFTHVDFDSSFEDLCDAEIQDDLQDIKERMTDHPFFSPLAADSK